MDLRGHTDVLSLFDLAQVLSVNEATGMLTVDSPDERGWIYFQAGAIINAMDVDHHEGEEAAKRVFSLDKASYSFATDLPSVAHVIDCGTQNLLMEIARHLDEKVADEPSDGSSRGERLLELHQASTALNEIFSRLDSESKILSHRSRQGWAVSDLLDPIRDTPEAVLYLRPDTAPEIRAGGRMIPISETALDAESYASLRDHMVREAHGAGGLGDEIHEGVLDLGEDGCWRIEIAHGPDPSTEVTTIRRIADATALPGSLPWPAETVDALLAAPGSLVILAGPGGADLDRAFAAIVDRYLRATGGPVVGMARAWPPGIGGGRAGAVLLERFRASEMQSVPGVIDRLEPALVALDDSDFREGTEIALSAARRGARALLGVRTPSLAGAISRLFDSVAPEKRSALGAHLGGGPLAILAVNPAWTPPALAWALDHEMRPAFAAGDFASMEQALAQLEAEASAT